MRTLARRAAWERCPVFASSFDQCLFSPFLPALTPTPFLSARPSSSTLDERTPRFYVTTGSLAIFGLLPPTLTTHPKLQPPSLSRVLPNGRRGADRASLCASTRRVFFLKHLTSDIRRLTRISRTLARQHSRLASQGECLYVHVRCGQSVPQLRRTDVRRTGHPVHQSRRSRSRRPRKEGCCAQGVGAACVAELAAVVSLANELAPSGPAVVTTKRKALLPSYDSDDAGSDARQQAHESSCGGTGPFPRPRPDQFAVESRPVA